MTKIEIRGVDIARCVVQALIQETPGYPFVLDGTYNIASPWFVLFTPCMDNLAVGVFGPHGSMPVVETTVPYPDGPRIVMLGEEFCEAVVQAADQMMDALTEARDRE